jgi:hypothetical protein
MDKNGQPDFEWLPSYYSQNTIEFNEVESC